MCVYVLGEIGFWLRVTGYVFHTHLINVSWLWCLLARRRDLVCSLWHWNETWNYRIWRRFIGSSLPEQNKCLQTKQHTGKELNFELLFRPRRFGKPIALLYIFRLLYVVTFCHSEFQLSQLSLLLCLYGMMWALNTGALFCLVLYSYNQMIKPLSQHGLTLIQPINYPL